MIRWGLYKRLSMDRNDTLDGVRNQEREIREHLERRGDGEVVEVYVDNDTPSKKHRKRPDYERMLADARRGHITGIAGWHIDRLTRHPIELEGLISMHEDHGTLLATVRGDIDLATPSGRLMARQLASFASYEMEHKGDRQRMRNRQRAELGLPHGGMRPFGYRHGGVELDPVESTALREAYHRVVAGEALLSIVRWLDEAGLTTATGRRWYTTTLRRTLLNGRNAGFRMHDGQVAGQAVWPAIVDETTWRRACALLQSPERGAGKRQPPRSYLLGGLIVCDLCDEPLQPCRDARKPDGRQGNRRYGCKKTPPFRGCGSVSSQAEWLEDYVAAMVLARVASPRNRERLAQQIADRDNSGATLAAGLAADERRIEQLARDFNANLLPASAFYAASTELQKRIDEANQRLAMATRTSLPTVEPEGAADWWNTAPLAQRKALVAMMLAKPIRLKPAARVGPRNPQPDRLVIAWA